MASNEFRVKCIKSGNDQVSVRYTEAFNALKVHGFKPQWVDENSCLEVKQKEKHTIYLLDYFEGIAFEHLKSLGSRILGPICVLTCLELKVEIPRTKVPIHNLAMKDTIISCTNIDKELRESIHAKVLMMGGEISRNLTEHVTHLVAGSVGSSKYQVASSLKKPIMLPEWVNRVWEAAQEGSVYCNDEKFQKYRCPVFKGLTITVSGLDPAERKEVKKLAEMEGAKYSGEMKVDECTHLIVNEPKGQKYEFARKWKICIVKPQWLYDSIEVRSCLKESEYSVSSEMSIMMTPNSLRQMKTSTPTKNTSTVDMTLSNISAITHLSDTVCNSVLTSNQTTCNTGFEKSKAVSVDQIDISQVSSDPFLDGYKIYVSGFRGADLEKLRKIINIGGGTRFNVLNEQVTHVVIGEIVAADIEYLQKAAPRPHIVTANWLIDCAKQSKSVLEKPYYVQNITFDNEPTPTPQSEKSAKNDRSLSLQKDISKVASEFTDNLDEEIALMSQYLPEASTKATDDEFKSVIPSNLNLESFSMTMQQDETNSESAVNHGLFSQKKFLCCNLGDDTSAVESVIVENGGKLLKNTRLIPDFGVVPLGGCDLKLTAHEIVTQVWLESCLEQACLLPVDSNILFQPIEINKTAKPLKDCVISFSGFGGVEKTCLMYLGDLLGATTQLFFVKKASKGMLANTHLVSREAGGSKYEAALKWNVHAITTDWLFACARSGKLEPEAKYKLTLSAEAASSIPAVSDKSTVGHEADVAVSAAKPAEIAAPLQLSTDDSKDKDTSLRKNLGSATDAENTLRSEQSDTMLQETNALSDGIAETRISNVSESQKENISAVATAVKNQEHVDTTPLQHSRVKELQKDKSMKLSPRQSNIQQNVDNETPSKFLGAGREYRPAFDLDSFTTDLESHVDGLSSSRSRRSSTPWSELFSKHIEEGVRISANAKTDEIINSQQVDPINDVNNDPLKDVVISVARKLSAHQSTYNDIAVSLGAGYTWTYDKKCTHFIFQGKLNDINREFRLAREQGKFIVSPYWLTMCKEQNARVDETLFPHTFNPNLSLQSIINGPKETPRRSKRSTRSVDSPAVGRTPCELKKIHVDIETHEKMDVDVPDVNEQTKTNNLGIPENDEENVIEMTDIQEALNKELENIKASGSKRSKKRAKKNVNSSVTDSSHTTPTSLSTRKSDSAQSKDKNKGSGSESSQSVQVMWDDPTERIEMQKVAAQLEKACCPTQDALDIHTPIKQNSNLQQPLENPDLSDSAKKNSSRTSTPEQPSIVFPLSKKLETVEAPQPIELLSDDEPLDAPSAVVDMEKPPCFLLSGIMQTERVDYGALIEELGGIVMEGQNYHDLCTHLIVGTPTRNEKFLACVASGKWVLHKSYFEDCRKAKRFVREEKHEWGSELTKSVLVGANSQTKSLAAAAQRWRLKILELKKQNPKCCGAFDKWSVVLCTDKKKESNFERLLKAGGAKVLSVRPPFNSDIEATHAFLELNKVPLTTEDLEVLLRNNILCLRPDYIAAYLTNDVIQTPEEFCPPEVVALRARLNLSDAIVRKRKSTLVNTDVKRNRNL